jgi:hypothetical protein
MKIEVEAEKTLGTGEGAGRSGRDLREKERGEEGNEYEGMAWAHGWPPGDGGIKIAEWIAFFKEWG